MSPRLPRVSTPIVIVFVAAFSVCALILLVCASVGFRQGVTARVVEGIGGLLCLVNAAGVPFVDHVTMCTLLWFVAPFAAVSNVLRIRRAGKLHQEQLVATYAAEAQDKQGPTG